MHQVEREALSSGFSLQLAHQGSKGKHPCSLRSYYSAMWGMFLPANVGALALDVDLMQCGAGYNGVSHEFAM